MGFRGRKKTYFRLRPGKCLGSKPCISGDKTQKHDFFGVLEGGKYSKKWGGVGTCKFYKSPKSGGGAKGSEMIKKGVKNGFYGLVGGFRVKKGVKKGQK